MDALSSNYTTLCLMAEVVDGNRKLKPLMEYLWDFRSRDKILYWCLKNNLTGINLEAWLKMTWGQSRLAMVKYILMKVDKSATIQPIFLGEEYRPR